MFDRVLLKNEAMNATVLRDVLLSCDLRTCNLCEIMASATPIHRENEGCECEHHHFICTEHFRGYVKSQLEHGKIKCFQPQCQDYFKDRTIHERAGPELLFMACEVLIEQQKAADRMEGEREGRKRLLHEMEEKMN